MLITVRQLMNFILANRHGNAFVGWSEQQLLDGIINAIEERSMSYSVDERGEINGVAIGIKFEEKKIFYVSGVLTTKTGVLGKLIAVFKELYPNWKLEAERCRRLKHYNTERFVNKLIALA